MVPLMCPALRSSPTWPLLLAYHLLLPLFVVHAGLALQSMPQDPPTPRACKSGKVARARANSSAVLAPCPFSHQKLGVFGRSSASGNLQNLVLLVRAASDGKLTPVSVVWNATGRLILDEVLPVVRATIWA
jgi:hypothetical protein